MVRDSKRLELADALDDATRFAYLAARRAEYEYTARLSGNNFRISDIYKARTANDVLDFLGDLDRTITSLPGAIKDAEIDDEDFKISVAQHVLGLTDKYLGSEGFSGDAIKVERERRFKQWVADRLGYEGGNQVLRFNFTTSSDTKGILSNVKPQGYDYYWLHKVAGIGLPLAGNTGTGINLVSDQPNLDHRQARISQTGQVELTSFAGCVFNYRLVPDAVMLGLTGQTTSPQIRSQATSGPASTAPMVIPPGASWDAPLLLSTGRSSSSPVRRMAISPNWTFSNSTILSWR